MRVCPRSSRRVAACSLAAVAAVALLAGCSGSVQGAPVPDSAPATAGVTDSGSAAPSTTAAPKSSSPKSASPKAAAPLSELLLTPEEFPEPFGAVVLPPQAVPMAAPDLVGVPRGATVDPSECEPPEQDYGPNGTVMAVGTDNATRATISVELTKVDAPLDELEAQTRQCPSMTVTANGVTTTVTTEILPPSPIDADKTMSLRRTVVSPKAAAGDQTMLTLIAQVGDVRVATTLMTFGSATPSTAPLDQAFTAAVQKVKAGK